MMRQMLWRAARSLLFPTLLVFGTGADLYGVQAPFLDPDTLDVDLPGITAHRLELRETTIRPDGTTLLDAYAYVTVDHSQAWGERHLMVNWTALTWNGTGFDINLAAEPHLGLRGRVTPRGVPFSQFVESHYYPGRHNRTEVNPDSGELRRYETLTGGPSTVYNEILWPYLLARLDLKPGLRFTLPGYSPYRQEPFFYGRFRVTGPVTIQDDEGRTHRGWEVEAIFRPTLDEVNAAADDAPGRHSAYFVSPDPPYFLGKERFDIDGSTGQRSVEKRWRLTQYRLLEPSAARRMEEILRVRGERGADQVIPWRE